VEFPPEAPDALAVVADVDCCGGLAAVDEEPLGALPVVADADCCG
jgi:hypothetical protein